MHTQSDTDGGSFCFQLLGFQSAKNTTKAPHQQRKRKEMEEANAKKRKILLFINYKRQ